MQRKDRKFDEIYDVFALRVIVPTISDCYKSLGVIHSIWKPMQDRIKDYIAMPKPNGYRSLHTTVYGPENKATEFQIRTPEMHEESLYGIAAHWYYKQKDGSEEDDLRQPHWIKEIIEKMRTAEESATDFIKDIKVDVFRNRIFVFTPRGDVFDLPENSSPIDFAYAVHTEIGEKAMGCLINNKMAALDTALKNGDMVEIIIDKKRKGPSQDWLKFVKTQRARDKIKHATNLSRLEKLKRMIPGI
jgi:GTP pyrophosphokinase